MKFTVYTEDFKNGMSKVEKVLSKSVLPIIENIKVEVNNNICSLFGSDLHQFVKHNIDTESNTYNNISFVFADTKTVIKAIKFFKDTVITFDYNETNGNVKMVCGDKKAEIKTLDAKDYLQFPEVTDYREYTYTAEDLSRRFNLIKYAVAEVDTRLIIKGIHFNSNDMVACDGCRLSLNRNQVLSVEQSFTVTTDTLNSCAKLLEKAITIQVNNKYIKVFDDQTSIIGRLLDGEYLDYKKFMPDNHNIMSINAKSFVENLKYLKIFITDKNKPYAMWQNDKIALKNNIGIYEGTIETKDTFDYKIAINIDYFIEAITQFDCKNNIEINMPDRNVSPMIIEDGENYALILPVRTNSIPDPFEKDMGETA